MNENLHFRRQFLLSKAPVPALAKWKCLKIDNYYLYAHPDLELTLSKDQKKSIALIGSLYDPTGPEKENAEILSDISANVATPETLFAGLKRYVGIYAVFYSDGSNAVMLHDALALREIYYCTKDNQIVCGSQPNLIVKFADPELRPTTDREFMEFFANHSKNSRWNPYCKWIGDETYYEGVRHLLPNHYLDLNHRVARRYWPNEPIKQLSLEEAVSKSSSFLQGTMRAMAHRHSLMVAVTAGTDSRTLLAASRGVKEKIYYFINNQGLGYSHPDISLPMKMCERIGVPFHVHDVPNEVDDDFRQIFLSNTFFATERILPTVYNVYYKNHGEKVNVLGIGEIGRTRYGKVPKNVNGYRMAYKLGYKGDRYAIQQGEQIAAELLPVAEQYGLNVLTLLYWEHTMGNWGTTGNSESDIALEEVDPYDSHLLYEIFLGVEGKYTKYRDPVLFREMIRYMWPELLEWPINPTRTMKDNVKSFLWKAGMFDLLKELKYQAHYFRHLAKTRLS